MKEQWGKKKGEWANMKEQWGKKKGEWGCWGQKWGHGWGPCPFKKNQEQEEKPEKK